MFDGQISAGIAHLPTNTRQLQCSEKQAADMSRVMRKPDFCICENIDADQLRGNHEADQRLCFR